MNKKIVAFLITLAAVFGIMTVSAEQNITMYSADGREISVAGNEIEAYKAVGWYRQPPVLMYAIDGRTIYVSGDEVEAYKAVGWYRNPPVLMYAIDGRTIYVSGDEVEAYKAVGWYRKPPVLMYAQGDKTLYVSGDEVEAYKTVGWYTSPVVKVCASDGRELFIGQEDVAAYEAVGWKQASIVTADKLKNLKSLKKGLTDAQFKEAYDIACELMRPVLNYGREDQLKYVATVLRIIFERNMSYSMSAKNYNNVYGYFIEGAVSCAGCTRATGLCLNVLGIPYEHVNENQYSHQWCRVKVGEKYWVCDAFGLFVGEEPSPYGHIYF